jgi:hypothetical protein
MTHLKLTQDPPHRVAIAVKPFVKPPFLREKVNFEHVQLFLP